MMRGSGMVTKEQTAKAKMRALAQVVKVWMLESGRRYVALSCSNDGTAYEIVVQSLEPGDITCTCPGASYRGVCKHIGAIMVRLEVEKEMAQVQESKIEDLYS